METYLVEIKAVQQINQLADLGSLGNLDKVLLESVQCELALIVNEDLNRLRQTHVRIDQ